MNDLAAEIVASLRVNLLRGAITTQDDAEFEKMVDNWSDRALAETPLGREASEVLRESVAQQKVMLDELRAITKHNVLLRTSLHECVRQMRALDYNFCPCSGGSFTSWWAAVKNADDALGLTEDKP